MSHLARGALASVPNLIMVSFLSSPPSISPTDLPGHYHEALFVSAIIGHGLSLVYHKMDMVVFGLRNRLYKLRDCLPTMAKPTPKVVKDTSV